MDSIIIEEKNKCYLRPGSNMRIGYHHFTVTIDHANLIKQGGFLTLKPNPYVVLVVDGEDIFRSKTIKRTYKPNWKQTFDIHIHPYSVMTYFVYDECMFKDDKLVAYHTVHFYEYLKTYDDDDGLFNELELTIDLVLKPRVYDLKEKLSADYLLMQPGQIKIGELNTVIKGFDMMAEAWLPEPTSKDGELVCAKDRCYRKILPKPEVIPDSFGKSYLAMCDYILSEYEEYRSSTPKEGEVKNIRAWKPLLDCIFNDLPLHPILLDSFIDSLKYRPSIKEEEEEEEEEQEQVEDEEEESCSSYSSSEEDDTFWKSILKERSESSCDSVRQ